MTDGLSINPRLINAGQFKQAFKLAPTLTTKALNKAVQAGLAEVSKRQNDNDSGLYDFRTRRAERTGLLAKMFTLNTATAIRTVQKTRLGYYAETFSTVSYADKIVEQFGNNFYQRILRDALPDIQRHNADAIEQVLKKIKATAT